MVTVGVLEIYQSILLCSAVVTGVLAAFAWQNRSRQGAGLLAGNLTATTLWLVTTFLSWTSSDLAVSMFWRRATYLGITLNIPFLFLFVLAYAGRKDLVTRRLVAVLAIQPVVANVLVWTNDAHGLVWAVSTTPGRPATLAYGPAFWGIVAYSYLFVFVSIGTIIWAWRRSQTFYRRQMVLLLVAILAPFLGNVAFLTLAVPYDVAPIAFAVTGVAFVWAVVRHRFLDLTPVARTELVAEMDTPVFVVDGEDRLVDVNEAGRAFLDGEPLGEPVGVAFESYPALEECYREETGVEGFVVERDGTDRFFDVQVTTVSKPDAAQRGTVLALNEVTKRQQRKRELQRQNEQLELVASAIAHDLRNPLNVAQLSVGSIETDDEEALARIERTLDRMEVIVEDMLTLARQDQQADPAPVSLAAVVEDAWNHVATRDATLSQTHDDATILADRSQVLTLLENLVGNAVQHGGEAVTVGTLADGTGFYVEDDGPGIPESERAEVFEHGFTTDEEGTGFGLAIVSRVADAHGWEVAVTDGTDGGARFEVTGVGPPGERESHSYTVDTPRKPL